MSFAESVVEEITLYCLKSICYTVLRGHDIAAGERAVERSDLKYHNSAVEALPPELISAEQLLNVIAYDLEGIQ